MLFSFLFFSYRLFSLRTRGALGVRLRGIKACENVAHRCPAISVKRVRVYDSLKHFLDKKSLPGSWAGKVVQRDERVLIAERSIIKCRECLYSYVR